MREESTTTSGMSSTPSSPRTTQTSRSQTFHSPVTSLLETTTSSTTKSMTRLRALKCELMNTDKRGSINMTLWTLGRIITQDSDKITNTSVRCKHIHKEWGLWDTSPTTVKCKCLLITISLNRSATFLTHFNIYIYNSLSNPIQFNHQA